MSNQAKTFKMKLNQNLWGLIVGFLALGISEYFKVYVLLWFSIVLSLVMVPSYAWTTWVYTKQYRNKRKNKISSVKGGINSIVVN